MGGDDAEVELCTYLRDAREVLVWKLDGLDEYDVRRPLAPSGTNLLGLVKHSGWTHRKYFGEVFGQTADAPKSPSLREPGPNADLWATADESRERVVSEARESWALADRVLAELPLDTIGTVPWWGDEAVTLHRVLVHVTAETQRHAGHADIVRELVDGSAGLLPAFDNLRVVDRVGQQQFHDQVEAAARSFRGD